MDSLLSNFFTGCQFWDNKNLLHHLNILATEASFGEKKNLCKNDISRMISGLQYDHKDWKNDQKQNHLQKPRKQKL